MALSQPQVEVGVNHNSVACINLGLQPCGMSPLGKVITSRLETLDHTQAWLAERVGVSENAVSKWIITGKISRANSIKVAAALHISLSELLSEHPTPDLDERWHALPTSLKRRLLDIVEELSAPLSSEEKQARKSRQRA